MFTAMLNGFVGIVLTLGIGIGFLDLQVLDVALCVLSSNIAALIAALTTLYINEIPSIFKGRVKGTFKTWSFLLGLYFGILLLLAAPIRNFQAFLYLGFPLILSTGFAIVVFGPIQDSIVRRKQKKSKIQSIRASWKKNSPEDEVALS